jgi:hypothetical protein
MNQKPTAHKSKVSRDEEEEENIFSLGKSVDNDDEMAKELRELKKENENLKMMIKTSKNNQIEEKKPLKGIF